jgi:cyanate permease
MYLLLQFIFGLNSILGVISALIYDNFPEKKRGSPLSFYTIGVVIGFVTGSILGGPLYSWLNQQAFLFICSLPILSILVILITIREQPMEIKHEETEKQKISTWGYIKTHKNIIGLLIQNFFNYLCFSGGGSYAVYVIFTYLNADPKLGGLYLIPIQLAEIVVFFLMGKICSNYGKIYRFMIFDGIIIGGLIIGLNFLQELWFFSFVLVFIGILLAFTMQCADVLSHTMIPKEHKSNLVSFYRCAGFLGSITGPAFFGILADEIWIFSPGVFLVIGTFLVVLMYEKWIK